MKSWWLIAATLTVTVLSSPLTVNAQDEEFEREQRDWRENIDARYQAWLREPDRQRKAELEDRISRAIIHRLFDRYELFDQFTADGKFYESEIKVPASAVTVTLQKIREFGDSVEYIDRGQVIRRMTKDKFELWTPKRGWLFAADGQLLNLAKVPRKDGRGREWHGAFLADGTWVTTDIWHYDCQLHFYSREGKWLRSVKARDLTDARWQEPIDWCRAAADGKSYVLCTETDSSDPKVWLYQDGKIRALKKFRQKCYPRDLEPKSKFSFIERITESDNGDVALERHTAGHGPWVGHPGYSIGGTINGGIWNPNASSFGFWPDSENVYINASNDYSLPEDNSNGARGNMCWFFRADGRFAGWVKAARLADADDGASMLFDAGRGKVVTISDKFKVTQAQKFRWADGDIAFPEKIFPDLKLGFFWEGKELVLARWR